ncbi:MAG: bifunctional 5,10-methylenetetrahydrofolate dehydrogenase/5,10-methenyltetrahydrofolate cyclohydrolase [Candidatus Omnitrophica bacterium]|nr:bifunctional 5,10-methylenetetrahydrofolate dehydrogenase/5,10-methenyltetrahydrofolate cyclohydrolase [Candidatus Omnitrophota bacterium]
MAKLLDGKILAQTLKDQLKNEVADLNRQFKSVPRLVCILIGEDKGAHAYANSQRRTAEYIGIEFELINLPLTITQAEYNHKILELNSDAAVHGIMLHKPVPSHIDHQAAVNLIDTKKDIEGINVINMGKMLIGEAKIIPCTPLAAMELIQSTNINIRGKEAVIVGASAIVGKPLSILLMGKKATVTVCNSATTEAGKLVDHISRADILVAAVGKPAMIKGEWIKEGAIVIDVGINAVGGKIVGDVDFESAQERASFITPVPGGVGPVTVVMFMKNGIEAFKMQLCR